MNWIINKAKIMNELQKTESSATSPQNILNDLRQIIAEGRKQAYLSVSQIAVATYWNVGKRIVEEEQNGKQRAEYGIYLIKNLSEELTKEFGAGYGKRNLEQYRQFYLCFKDLPIANTRVRNLSWSHFRRLMSVQDHKARQWYANEAATQDWSVRTLDRNIQTQYYYRLLSTQRESLGLPSPEVIEEHPLDYIKNPVVAEFLGFRKDSRFDESELEQALIDNLQQFIMELGRGFAFVDRQKHIHTDAGDFYIDLVFYNIKLHCYVLIDLKTHQITHQDVGQMDMYIRMFDDLVKGPDDNKTVGIVLCSETSKDIARYSVLNDSDQIFAAKYMSFMPTEEELRHEIEVQKQLFFERNGKQLN